MFGLTDYLAALNQRRYPAVWAGHYRDSRLLASLMHGIETERDQAIYEVLMPLALSADVSTCALMVNDHIARRLYHGSFLVTDDGWQTDLTKAEYEVDDHGKLVVTSAIGWPWMTPFQTGMVELLSKHRGQHGGTASLESALLAAIGHKK